MNLLPKSKEEFSSKSYWESFFGKREDAFEWYGEYTDLCEILHKYCKQTDKILMSGCGNSHLSEDMYNAGYHDIINIDISDVVIKKMTAKVVGRMPYIKMDMKETTFDCQSFNVIIDKGTLDAIFTDDNMENSVEVEKMFKEIIRLLKIGGRYICVTLAQHHILNKLFSFFSTICFIRVHQIEIIKEEPVKGLGSNLPVFTFVCTKMKSDLINPLLEMVLSGNSTINKYKDSNEVIDCVKMLQNFAIVKNKLENSSLAETITLDLWVDNESCKEPRYSISIIDTEKAKLCTYNGIYGVFIVPQGRENEAIFGTESGRKQLAETAGFIRLAVAYLHRGHVYKDLEQIKAELSGKIMDLAPINIDKKQQVPFLSTSSDIGNRVVVHESESVINGSFIIEDVQSGEQYYYRQLICRREDSKLMTKARLMVESKKKKKCKKRIPDHRYLINIYDRYMLTGISLLQNIDFENIGKLKILMFGISGGCFISFLLELFPDIHVTLVEDDTTMVEISKDWFGLPDSNQIIIVSKDISQYLAEIRDLKNHPYDLIIINNIFCRSSGNPSYLNENLFPKISDIMNTSGLLIYLQMNHADKINDGIFLFSYELVLEDNTFIQFFVKCKSNEDKITSADVKLRIEKMTDYICSKRKGFYSKDEWNLSELIENIIS